MQQAKLLSDQKILMESETSTLSSQPPLAPTKLFIKRAGLLNYFGKKIGKHLACQSKKVHLETNL